MLDRAALEQAVLRHGAVVRVVICAHQGSSPREAGAAMLIWADTADGGGQSGSIGGGTLEYEATRKARAILSGMAGVGIERQALGPNLGQCCGGAVTLGYERFEAQSLAAIPNEGLFARSIGAETGMPLAIRRALKSAREEGLATLRYAQSWLAEPVAPQKRALWVWGAGHVGRAVVNTLAPLPDLDITWIDTAPDRFPDAPPDGVTPLPARNPQALVPTAPPHAEHLIMTYSHALDFDLCHGLLIHGFQTCGLIGSASKWARFRSRLRGLGHAPAEISRINCPIGEPALGKHPQAIAISVAASFLAPVEAVRAMPASLAQSQEIRR